MRKIEKGKHRLARPRFEHRQKEIGVNIERGRMDDSEKEIKEESEKMRK